ncbi:MAG TPA: peptidylprolyl isomerase [Labilithrix sp.]
MLNLFRQKGLTSAVYGLVIVATVLVFILGFNPTAGKKLGSISEACAARVAGNCIEPKAHRAAYRLVFSRGTPGMKPATASRIVLDGLIERELLDREAARLGLTVSEDEITNSIYNGFVLVSLPSDAPNIGYSLGFEDGKQRVPFFFDPKTKQFDLKAYERNVKSLTGRSPAEFREWQARELLAAKMRDLVRAPVRVADDEALDRFVIDRTTATLSYVVVRRSWLEKYGITADQKDLDAWSKDRTNLAQIVVPVRHILIKAEKPEDKEKAKVKAQGIWDRVKKGEDFAKLAKEFSEDPGSKDKGGQYPGEMVSSFVEPFKNAVNAVKPGELVDHLVETNYGWHIIKRDEATKDDILKAYRQSKSLDLAKKMAQQIASDLKAGKSGEDAIKAAIDKFAIVKTAPAAKPKTDANAKDGGASTTAQTADAGPPEKPMTADQDPERPQILTTSPFSQGGTPIPAISDEAGEAAVKFAFAAKPGDVSDPIRTDDGFLDVQLKEIKPATKAEFDKERDQFMDQFLVKKQAEALGAYVKRLREASKDEIKIDENNVFGAKSDAGPSRDDEDEGP